MDFVNCEMCSYKINCEKENIHILYLADDEMTICTECFTDNETELKENGWKSDDWDET